MNVYIYCADIYCEDCGEDIKKQIRKEAKATGKTVGEYLEIGDCPLSDADSDAWPQGPYEDGGGESDSPCHCGAGDACLNAEVLKDGTKIGAFLENPLTQEGYDYVKESIVNELRHEGIAGEVARMWADYYDVDIDMEEEDEDQS